MDIIGIDEGDELDAIVGGPPCQGYSAAGKRNVHDPRNSLVFEMLRLVIEVRPKTMIFENVPHILSMMTPEGIPVIEAMTRVLEDGGFGGLDTIRRTLQAQLGVVIGRGNGRRPSADKKAPSPEPQPDLFPEAAE